ncbi:MAG TPA: DUF1186 domain-containing protein [Verrucomicrobiae bacterium]|nr:DUF1186 domain-containing protein [Verrucomicrobiae bacterium]
MKPADILKKLERLPRQAPRAALDAAIRQKAALVPKLLAALDHVTVNAGTLLRDPQYVLHIHALLLLAQLRERDALKPMLPLFSLLGDMDSYESEYFIDIPGLRILASVSQGNIGLLLETAAGENNNPFLRCTAIEAMALLAIWGRAPRAQVIGRHRELLRSRLARPGDPLIWAGVVSSAFDLKARGLLPEIRAAFKAGLVNTDAVSLDFVEKGMTTEGDALRRRYVEMHPPITSAIEEFKAWQRYREREEKEKQDEEALLSDARRLFPFLDPRLRPAIGTRPCRP